MLIALLLNAPCPGSNRLDHVSRQIQADSIISGITGAPVPATANKSAATRAALATRSGKAEPAPVGAGVFPAEVAYPETLDLDTDSLIIYRVVILEHEVRITFLLNAIDRSRPKDSLK